MKNIIPTDTREYLVLGKKEEAPGVSTLFLENKSGGVPTFVPGQYINVYFPETGTPEGKAYSI